MKKNIHRIKITLQTPLAVGNDKSEQLSPLCDFIIKGREALYIDPDKLGKLVLEKGLMDEFVSASGQLSNTQTRFQLEQFIRNRLGAEPEKLLLHKFPVRGRPDRRMYIRPLLKSAGRPLIPGSTIKGAIKTALLYNWLCNSETGKSKVNGILEMTDDLYKGNTRLIEAIDSHNHEIDVLSGKIRRSKPGSGERIRLKDQQHFLRKQVKSEKDTLSSNIRKLDEKLSETIEVLFGRLGSRKETRNDFFCLRVTDSSLLNTKDIVISEVKRLHLMKAELQTPQYMETLREKTTAEFELTVLPEMKQKDLQFLNHPDPEVLWGILNEFSKASAETDWDILDSHAEDFEKNNVDGAPYTSLFDFFENLAGTIGSDTNTAHIRLGFGKTFFDNSLGLSIYRESKEIFMQYVKLLQLGKPRQTEFPVTRTVCTDPLKPMGWVTLKY